MRCEEILHLISGHLDGCNNETEKKDLQEHLQQCADCRAVLAQMEQNDRLLSHMVEPPAELTARIMDAVRKEPRRRNRKRWYTSIATAGLATAALLALVFFGSTALPSLDAKDAAMEIAPEAPNSMERKDGAFLTKDELHSDCISETYSIGEDVKLYTATPSVSPDEQEITTPPQYAQDSAPAGGYSAEESVMSAPSNTGGSLPLPAGFPLNRSIANTYGLLSPDGTVQELPTLIIWEADITNFPDLECLPLDTEDQTLLTAFDPEDDSFYERFLSSLPTEHSLLGSGTLRSRPSLSLSRYSLSYDNFTALLEAAAGKYELSVYFPTDLTEVEDCLVIFICSEE